MNGFRVFFWLSIAFVLIAVLCFGFLNFCAQPPENEVTEPGYNIDQYYARAFRVIAVDGDIVVIRDSTGNVFRFFAPDSDWEIGDGCACIMDGCGTDEITDDVIVTASFSGF